MRYVSRAAASAPVLARGGCESPPPRPVFPDIRFTSEPPIRLDVARIDDARATTSRRFRSPNVEHLFPVPPARARGELGA